MLDLDKYLMRHGECWVWEILKGIERHRGLRIAEAVTLEERWDFLMNDAPTFARGQQVLAA